MSETLGTCGVVTQDQSIRPLHSERGYLYFACTILGLCRWNWRAELRNRDAPRLEVGLGAPHPRPHSGSYRKTLQIHSVNSIEGEWGYSTFFFLMVHIYCSVIYSQCF